MTDWMIGEIYILGVKKLFKINLKNIWSIRNKFILLHSQFEDNDRLVLGNKARRIEIIDIQITTKKLRKSKASITLSESDKHTMESLILAQDER